MKKFIFLLSFLICFTLSTPCFAKEEKKEPPTIIFASNGTNKTISTIMDVCEQYLKKNKYPIKAIELDFSTPLLQNNLILTQTIEKIKNLNPKLILSIGLFSTTKLASATTDIPIVFAKIQKNDADYLKIVNRKTTGVLESLFLEQKINLLKEMFPNIKTLGIITNVEKNKQTVYDIKIATRNLKLTPVIINVESIKFLHQELTTNIDNVDAIMILPSEEPYSEEAIKFISSLCTQKNKFLIGYTPLHVENGALLAIYEDNISQATKTAQIMERILNFESPTAIPFTVDDNYFTALNVTIAKKTNAKLSSGLLDKLDIVIK